MRSEASTFDEFLGYFEARELSGDGTVPMLRFLDAKLERAVARTTAELEEQAQAQAATHGLPALTGRTRLRDTSAQKLEVGLGDWLGRYRVPRAVQQEPITVIRSVIGTGLSCAPGLDRKRFSDPMLEQGEAAQALLAVLGAFARPTSLDAAREALRRTAHLDPHDSLEVIEHLAAGRFLQPA
jgi:hypothetical protein